MLHKKNARSLKGLSFKNDSRGLKSKKILLGREFSF